MQQQQINYKGISFCPDDYNSADGELTTAINLVNESGALATIEAPKEVMRLLNGDTLLYIHHGNEYQNYIIYSSSDESISFISNTLKPDEKQIIFKKSYTTTEQINNIHITALGNTLIISDYSGVKYALCKGASLKYIYLGEKPPVISIQFGLNGEFTTSNKVDHILDGHVGSNTIPPDAKKDSFSLKNISTGDQAYVNWIIDQFTNSIITAVNKFIKEQATDKNRFLYPFLIRYAYRLYDGTYMMHSHPVLMIPIDGRNPTFFLDKLNCHGDGESGGVSQTQINITGYVSALLCNLDYVCYLEDDTLNDINNWKDIIKSIDIFVTAPIYTYNQNEKIYGWKKITQSLGINSVAKITNPSKAWTDNKQPHDQNYNSYIKQSYEYQFMCSHDYVNKNFMKPEDDSITLVQGFPTPRYIMDLPQINEGDYIKSIQEASIFYRIANIDIADLNTCKIITKISIKDNILNTLQQQPTLPDDYKSHSIISAKCSYVYNSRLNLGNITETLFKGMPLRSQLTRWENVGSEAKEFIDLFVHINDNGEEFTVRSTVGSLITRVKNSMIYFFYPDTRAHAITIKYYTTDGKLSRMEIIPLTEHPLLNGAYYFKSFNPIFKQTSTDPSPESSRTIHYPSKIYTSEVNNPFIFLPARINTVGNGNITALCSATNAISQGQFGQFPLYAFTSEGIWALEISSTGGFSSRQPVSRDVLQGRNVLQLDQAISFPTDKGIMIIQGGTSQCISTALEGSFTPANIIKFSDITTLLGFSNHLCNYNFMAFIKDCVMAYDYVNSRIFISNPKLYYSYVFSTKSGLWSIIDYAFTRAINSYPQAIVTQDHKDGQKVDNLNSDTHMNAGLVITRPLKFNSPTLLKTISALITRGNTPVRKDSIATVLLGSIDGITFTPIASSTTGDIRNIHGSAYKFFQVIQRLNILPNESITGVELVFEHKRTNKLR